MVTAHIRDYEVINDNTAHVVAALTFESKASVDSKSVRDAIQLATNSKLTPVEGTVILREDGVSSQSVSAFVQLSSEVIAVPEAKTVEEATGFKAVSSNMFLDDNENLWELKAEGGKNLIRSHVENNQQEMQELMASISSVSFSSMSSADHIVNRTIEGERNMIEGGDFITYISESGELEGTTVIAAVTDEPQSLVCLSSDMKDAIVVPRKNVAQFVKGTQYLGEMQEPEFNKFDSESSAVGVEKLVEYYSRLYAHNPNFRDQLLTRIKSHAYA